MNVQMSPGRPCSRTSPYVAPPRATWCAGAAAPVPPASLNVHIQLVGPFVDVSVKVTSSGAQPDSGVPKNFASVGGTIGAPPPGTAATTPSLIGKVVSASAARSADDARDDRRQDREFAVDADRDVGAERGPGRDDRIGDRVGQSQLICSASRVIRLGTWPAPPASPAVSGSCHADAWSAASFAAIRAICWRLTHPQIDAAEIDRDKHEEEQDREDQGEFDDALAARSLSGFDRQQTAIG